MLSRWFCRRRAGQVTAGALTVACIASATHPMAVITRFAAASGAGRSLAGARPAAHHRGEIADVTSMLPDESVTTMTCEDDELVGTRIEVPPNPA
jgi:hypothetical protein